ncbi:MAG: glycosyltransferase [Pseudonocardiaceae bacterium]|nr:glycosyltransferase [Pseudonocardiaceae bacterium]
MLTERRVAAPHETATTLAEFARRPVYLVAGAMALLMLLTSGRYGYFGDELYFIAAGHHLDWGYADQPPLVPLLAATMDTLFPGSLVALRLPSILLTALGVIVTALITRELGGERRAQIIAAIASASSPFLLACAGHWMATQTLDPFLWAVISWLVVRWVRTRDDNNLLLAGIFTAITLQGKLLIPVFWLAVGVSLLIVGPSEMLRRKKLWIGAAITVVSAIPTLLWQASNGWPQLEMQRAISAEQAGAGGRLAFVPAVLVMAGLVAGSVLLVYGLWRLLWSDELRAYRFFGLAAIGIGVFFVVSFGRPYYVAGIFAICWAAGAVELQRQTHSRWWTWLVSRPVWALSAAVAVSFLPLNPLTVQETRLYNPINLPKAELGWPQLAETTAKAYRALPPDEKRHTVVMANNYWEAGALEHFGPEYGLEEPIYSPHRGYWYFGGPPTTTSTVLFAGGTPETVRKYFGSVRKLATVDNEIVVDNNRLGPPIWLCEQPRKPWRQLWPEMREFTFR